MTNLTREQWDAVAKARISAMLFGGRVKPEVAIRHANETMVQDYGPRPEKEKPIEEVKPPWWARAALRVTVGKGNGMAQRIIVSLVYALSAMMAAYQAGGLPQTGEAWAAFIMAGVIAFWAKFSSNQTVIAANRPPWTDEQRAKESLDQLNKGL